MISASRIAGARGLKAVTGVRTVASHEREMLETSYAVRGDAHIAYQVIGRGDVDLIAVSTWFSHLEARWELPGFAHYLDRLGAFARVVSFDKYGIGLSDPIPSRSVPPLEEWADDVRAVMDTVGIERAAAFLQSASRSAGGVSRIYTTGGGARIPGINQVLADRLRLPVQMANPLERLQVADGVFDMLEVDHVAPLLMLPIGLALRSAA